MKLLFFLLLLFIIVAPVGVVFADDAGIDLASFDDMLAEKLNVSLFAAQLLASVILISLPLFPAMMIAGYFGGMEAVQYVLLFVGFSMMGVCVALAWMPVWIMIIVTLIVAVLLASKFKGVVSGL